MSTVNLSPQQNTNIPKKVNTKKQKYNDPLNTPILKAISYSDEVGTAISEVAPKLGAALWVPSFMYLGADIYDKYKNNKDQYSPSKKRAFERAIYQGTMNLVALPLLIATGQRIVSPLTTLWGAKLSVNQKDAIYKHTRAVLAQVSNEDFCDKTRFQNLLRTTLENKIESRKAELKTNNIFKKVYRFLKNDYALAYGNKENLINYAQNNASELFTMRTGLLNSNVSSNVPKSVINSYKKILSKMKETYGHDYSNQALKSALIKLENKNIFKNKLLKTLGGFVALGLLASPVNKFVEKVLVGKYVENGLDYMSNNVVNNSNMKKIFDDLKSKPA